MEENNVKITKLPWEEKTQEERDWWNEFEEAANTWTAEWIKHDVETDFERFKDKVTKELKPKLDNPEMLEIYEI